MGRRDTPGRPILYGTTFTFLERFGLTSLDDRPAIEDGQPPSLPAAEAQEPVDAG
jgi:segregation and condensation protein B